MIVESSKLSEFFSGRSQRFAAFGFTMPTIFDVLYPKIADTPKDKKRVVCDMEEEPKTTSDQAMRRREWAIIRANRKKTDALRCIKQNPGITIPKLADQIGASSKTITALIALLKEDKKIWIYRYGQEATHFFSKEREMQEFEQKRMEEIYKQKRLNVIRHLKKHKAFHASYLPEISRTNAHGDREKELLARLLEDGTVIETRRGRYRIVTLGPNGCAD